MSELTEELKSRLYIGYEPMKDEPDYRAYLALHGFMAPAYVIPPSKELEPEGLARELAQKFSDVKVAIFVPGRKFDHMGTRHGRGHGWYDRLFAAAPREWLRIGVSGGEHMSAEILARQSWDEPMDFILLEENGAFRTIETGAR